MLEALTALQIGLLTTAVIGATEVIRRAMKRDFEAVIIIIVAALIGALGACAIAGFTAVIFLTGLAVGLAGSGVVTVGQKIGSTNA